MGDEVFLAEIQGKRCDESSVGEAVGLKGNAKHFPEGAERMWGEGIEGAVGEALEGFVISFVGVVVWWKELRAVVILGMEEDVIE